jgi:hypothetical protein
MGQTKQQLMARLDALEVEARDIRRLVTALVDVPAAQPAPASNLEAKKPLAWGAKVSPAFRDRVRLFGQDFSFDPNWLMACMAFETMRTFRADIRPINRQGKRLSSAVGLIQFLEATARELGTSTDALAKMTPEKQLDYVWLYFRNRIRQKGPIRNVEDCYMAIHWPAAMGKPLSSTMYVRGSSAYAANLGLDTDKNGVITKAEAGALIRAILQEGLQPKNLG